MNMTNHRKSYGLAAVIDAHDKLLEEIYDLDNGGAEFIMINTDTFIECLSIKKEEYVLALIGHGGTEENIEMMYRYTNNKVICLLWPQSYWKIKKEKNNTV